MNGVIVDTSVWISYFKGRPGAASLSRSADIAGKGGAVMATSSITANFRIDDARKAGLFVDALCAETCAEPDLPDVRETVFETRAAEREFFLSGPYGAKCTRVRKGDLKK